jgi:hypothetical protein
MSRFKDKDDVIIFLMSQLENTIGYTTTGPIIPNPSICGLAGYYYELSSGSRKDKIKNIIIQNLVEENKDLNKRIERLEKIILEK